MLAILLGLILSAAQAAGPGRGPEGSLRNDAYVAVDEEAARALARGDAALVAARGARGQLDPARLGPAFEAWRAACERAAEGAAVPLDLARFLEQPAHPWPDPDDSAARRTEAVPYAVLRRLAALEPAAREAWEGRLGALALERLGAAGRDPAGLAALERELPGTRGAARAALLRADLELEEGRGFWAATWLERAAAHAGISGQAEILAAVQRRRDLARVLLDPVPASEPGAWERAGSIRSLEALDLAFLRGRAVAASRRAVALGLVPLGQARVAVVGPDLVWLRGEGGPARSFEPGGLLRSHGLEPLPQAGPASGPRIPSLPLGDARGLVFAHGRANPFLGLGNALLSVRPPQGVGLPELLWALGPFGLARPGAATLPLAEVLGAGLWEFQPGPLRIDGVVYVQVRRFALAEPASPTDPATEAHLAEAWLVALDAGDGHPLWKRFLGQGNEVSPEQADRHGGTRPVRSPAEPLSRAGARLFAGTGLGFGALLEPAEGRVAWTFLGRRRRAEEPGWRVGAPAPHDAESSPPRLFWAPGDSDHLYLLRAEPDLDGGGLLLAAPDPIAQGEELAGGSGARALVLSALGPRRTLEERDLVTGARRRSLYLRPGERFLGGALVSPARALVATDRGLYLFDRERELRLLDQAPFEVDADAPGGGLFGRAAHVWVLAGGSLMSFLVE